MTAARRPDWWARARDRSNGPPLMPITQVVASGLTGSTPLERYLRPLFRHPHAGRS
jgi:hypothetical protein